MARSSFRLVEGGEEVRATASFPSMSADCPLPSMSASRVDAACEMLDGEHGAVRVARLLESDARRSTARSPPREAYREREAQAGYVYSPNPAGFSIPERWNAPEGLGSTPVHENEVPKRTRTSLSRQTLKRRSLLKS